MTIKKYTGKTAEEAIGMAKKEMGNSIVVLNTRNVKRKGLFAAFRSKLAEVTVALEEEPEKQPLPPKKEAMQSRPRAESIPSLLSVDSKNIEEKLDTLQTLLLQQMQQNAQEKKEEAADTTVSGPKADREEEKKPETEKNPESVKFMRLLYNTMLDNEVDEKYANQIMEEIDKLNKPNMPFDYTLANTYQKMILKFGKAAGIYPAKSGPKLVIFLGPTGVGKTTTIAKISGSFAVEGKKKVALLTADTYRIAAAEQLRTYANILEVPFRVVYTEEEIQTAIKDFKTYDYIFLDTAGHSHQNQEQIEKMRSMVDCVDGLSEKQVFLVLSATTKYKDLLRIADNYKQMSDYQLIFTKLDETSCVGNMLNVKLYTNTSIAYVTYGQNVPDDIEVFNPQKTVKQLLGGKTQ
jgi:flagellar biosynthesis protein FlhF